MGRRLALVAAGVAALAIGHVAARATAPRATIVTAAAPSTATKPAGGSGDRLKATRVLAQKLVATGRGEAAFTLTRDDPMGGSLTLRGTLALEPPDRVRLEFPETGERITVRGDGGEWLQPSMRQLIRLQPEQAGVASWLWDLFLHGGGGRFVEREAGRGRYLLTFRHDGDALPETLAVSVDAAGLPATMEVRDPALGRSIYRFAAWKFVRPRGRAAFVLQAPRGYTVLEEAGFGDGR